MGNCYCRNMFAVLAAILTLIPLSAKESGEGGVTPPLSENSHETIVVSDSAVVETFRLYYRWDEVSVDTTYLDNSENIRTIIENLQNSPRIDSIEVYSWASPEGSYARNRLLAEKRAETARRFILKYAADSTLTEDRIKLYPEPENWQGLYEEAYAKYHRWDREWVLKTILADVPPETKEWRFKHHDNGVAWRWLQRNCMPKLRLATWICVWERPARMETVEAVQDSIPEDRPEYTAPHRITATGVPPRRTRTVAALKTNLLYDAVTALNVEVEIPVGDRFSIMVEDVFPWWTWGPNGNKYAFQMWEMGIEPRYWFKKSDSRDRLAGHFAGVYAMSAKYDFQYDYKGCYQGEYWSAGLTYGYAMPICKWLNMEFSLSLGYLRGPYRHYVPSDGYEVLWRDKYLTGTFNYFGITKAKVSLVIPISYSYSLGTKGKRYTVSR